MANSSEYHSAHRIRRVEKKVKELVTVFVALYYLVYRVPVWPDHAAEQRCLVVETWEVKIAVFVYISIRR